MIDPARSRQTMASAGSRPSWRTWRLAVLLAPAALAACASPVQVRADKQIATHAKQAMESAAPPSAPLISTSTGKWLLGQPVRVQPSEPAWLNQSITLNAADPMTLQEIGASIGTSTGVVIQIDPTAQSALKAEAKTEDAGGASVGRERRVMIGYSGPLHGLLDRIAASYALYWRTTNGAVVFFAKETRAFHIPALPISFSNTGTITTSTGSAAGASASGQSGAPTTTGTGTISQSDTLSVNTWAGLQQTAQSVAGPGSAVVADPSNALLVVTGSPSQIERVQSWVDALAKSMVRRIAIDVQVFDVTDRQENQVGFNPSVLFKDLGQRYGFSLSGIAAPQPTGGVTPMTLGASIISPLTSGGSPTIPGFGPTVTSGGGTTYLPNQGFPCSSRRSSSSRFSLCPSVGGISMPRSRSAVAWPCTTPRQPRWKSSRRSVS